MNAVKASSLIFLACAPFLFCTPLIAQGVGTAESVPDGLSPEDWTSIREAYDANRHKIVPDVTQADGLRAYNPGQAWDTFFDRRSFLTQPASGEWSWGLQLHSYGFAGQEQEIKGEASACADGGRLTYTWNQNLDEWYVNDTRGLEHGYTLWERPSLGDGPLTFTLDVRGDLRAEVATSGTSVAFLNTNDQVVLTYAGLTVFDAKGTTQQAFFTGAGTELRMEIEEAGATYPLTIDPVAQQAYLKASNSEAEDHFGRSVAISGDWIVVSARGESSNATGVNGNQSNNGRYFSGAAYVFERSGGVWNQQAYLKASNPDVLDQFGHSVAISGNLIVVGATLESSSASGVNGDQNNNNLYSSGAAYVFERSAGIWSQQAYLKASNPGHSDVFGHSVAISGDRIVVAALKEDSNGAGANGNPTNNVYTDAGAAYVFERSGGTWSQQAYLKASNADIDDHFGASVAISGELVVIGAPVEDSNATGINGNQLDNSILSAGAAYAFERSGGTWSQQVYLKASNTGQFDGFGGSVAVSGDRIVVGAGGEDSHATGVNGNQLDNSATAAGAAYVFDRSGGMWSQQAYLKASNPDVEDSFGALVAVSGDLVVVGASGEDSYALGVGGNQSNNSAPYAGAAYVFELSSGIWRQLAYLKASNTQEYDFFATSIALSELDLVIGAFGEDSNSNEINGDQLDNLAENSGAAYAFDIGTLSPNYCGLAVPNSSGRSARMSISGSLVAADNTFTLHANGLPLDQFGYFLNSTGQDYVTNPASSQGTLCLGGGAPIGRHHASLQSSSFVGYMEFTLDLTNVPTPAGPTTIQAGQTWNFQCWFRDNNPGSTSNFSDAVSVQFE